MRVFATRAQNPRYRNNILSVIFQPQGCVAEYRFQKKYHADLANAFEAQTGDDILIVVIDGDGPGLKLLPVRTGKILAPPTVVGDFVLWRFELSGFVLQGSNVELRAKILGTSGLTFSVDGDVRLVSRELDWHVQHPVGNCSDVDCFQSLVSELSQWQAFSGVRCYFHLQDLSRISKGGSVKPVKILGGRPVFHERQSYVAGLISYSKNHGDPQYEVRVVSGSEGTLEIARGVNVPINSRYNLDSLHFRISSVANNHIASLDFEFIDSNIEEVAWASSLQSVLSVDHVYRWLIGSVLGFLFWLTSSLPIQMASEEPSALWVVLSLIFGILFAVAAMYGLRRPKV